MEQVTGRNFLIRAVETAIKYVEETPKENYPGYASNEAEIFRDIFNLGRLDEDYYKDLEEQVFAGSDGREGFQRDIDAVMGDKFLVDILTSVIEDCYRKGISHSVTDEGFLWHTQSVLESTFNAPFFQRCITTGNRKDFVISVGEQLSAHVDNWLKSDLYARNIWNSVAGFHLEDLIGQPVLRFPLSDMFYILSPVGFDSENVYFHNTSTPLNQFLDWYIVTNM